MMTEQLRKLAALLRERADQNKKTKLVKCAQAAQAALGLALLQQKIGG